MFNIGDKVVYPMHGAGIVESIEEKQMYGDNENENYYTIRMPLEGIKVMVPTSKASSLGVREVCTKDVSNNVYCILEQPMEELSLDSNWNKRYNANVEKIKSGSIEEVTEVFKDLSHRHMVRGLSLGEKKMLTTSKNILLSELVLSQEESHETLGNKIEELISKSFNKYKSSSQETTLI